jgi:hypothetical protein
VTPEGLQRLLTRVWGAEQVSVDPVAFVDQVCDALLCNSGRNDNSEEESKEILNLNNLERM